MARRLRRKRRYTWFPTLGNRAVSEDPGSDQYGIRITLSDNASPSQALAVLPIVPDEPQEGDVGQATATPLVDVIGNEWALERIVGRLDAIIAPETDNAGAIPPGTIYYTNFIVGAGFFVARADFQNPTSPLVNSASVNEDFNPLNVHCIREPWLWHRSWTLGSTTPLNGAMPLANRATPQVPAFPTNLAILTGPNGNGIIDTSSKRTIGQDDRLFFAVGLQPATFGQTGDRTADTPSTLFLTLFVRILGQLRRPRIQGKF